MGRYFNNRDQGPTYYFVLGVICAVMPVPAFWVGYLCVRAGQYWPLIWVATITGLLWLTSYYLFGTARRIKQAQNKPKDDL